MKTAFISGVSGQDGAYLSQLLLREGYQVFGGVRRSASGSLWRLEKLGIKDEVRIVDIELTDRENITRTIREIQPNEFYNLGAMSFVGASWNTPLSTLEINGMSVAYELEAIRNYSNETKFYQACTSEMYGKVQEIPQTERTPFYPRSPYGVSKLMAYWLGKNYRESFGMFVCNGILFNHESPLRGEEFVTRKITKHVGSKPFEVLKLGNLEAKRDWGHARDYVKAMYKMMQKETSDDYVVATGETHTVKEFVETAYNQIGKIVEWVGEGDNEKGVVDGKVVIEVDKGLYRPAEVEILLGNSQKARNELGWNNKESFIGLVTEMVNSDMKV